MTKPFSIILTNEALEIVEKYMEVKKCTRNKAVNDLIVAKKSTSAEKMFKDINKKLDELKVILTTPSEE